MDIGDPGSFDGGADLRGPEVGSGRHLPACKGHTGQIVNWGAWSIAAPVAIIAASCAFLLAYPVNAVCAVIATCAVLYSVYLYYVATCTSFVVRADRIETRKGVFSPTTNNLPLYRVRDVQVQEPLAYRPFSLGNVKVISTDRSTPTATFRAIKSPHQVAEVVRHNTEIERMKKGVREIDH